MQAKLTRTASVGAYYVYQLARNYHDDESWPLAAVIV